MEIHNKRKLLRAPPNLTINSRQKNTHNFHNIQQPNNQLNINPSVSTLNLSRINDRTQRTQFKQQQSILNDFDLLLGDAKRQSNHNKQQQHDQQQSEKYIDDDYGDQYNNHGQMFRQQYEKVLQMLTYSNAQSSSIGGQNNNQISQSYLLIKSFQILTNLVESILRKKTGKTSYQILQNTLLNFWKVSSDLFFNSSMSNTNQTNNQQNLSIQKLKSKKQLTQQKQKQKIISYIVQAIKVLQEITKQQKIPHHRLTIICLILAKEYYKQKDMGFALEYCEKGFRLCPKFKNTSLLLKLHYLKSKIYNSIKAVQPQMQQIKKCIFFLKNLANNANENKQFGYEFMKVLIKRRDQLKSMSQGNSIGGPMLKFSKSIQKFNSNNIGTIQQQTPTTLTTKGSLTKFRKRSISLSKLKCLNEQILSSNVKTTVNNNKFNSTHGSNNNKMSVNNNSSSANNLLIGQKRNDFLKLDINRKTKLRKKGQTLTIWDKNSEKINLQDKIARELNQAVTLTTNNQHNHQHNDQSVIEQSLNNNNVVQSSNSYMPFSSQFSHLMLKRPNSNKQQQTSQLKNRLGEDKIKHNAKQGGKKTRQQQYLFSQDKQKYSLHHSNSLNKQKQTSKKQSNNNNQTQINQSSTGVNNNNNNDFTDNHNHHHNHLNEQTKHNKNTPIVTKNNNQLARFITIIQDQIMQRYFLKSIKFSHKNQQTDDIQNNNQIQNIEHHHNIITQYQNINQTNQGGRKEYSSGHSTKNLPYVEYSNSNKIKKCENAINSNGNSNSNSNSNNNNQYFKNQYAIEQQEQQSYVEMYGKTLDQRGISYEVLFKKILFQRQDQLHNSTGSQQGIITSLGIFEQITVQVRIKRQSSPYHHQHHQHHQHDQHDQHDQQQQTRQGMNEISHIPLSFDQYEFVVMFLLNGQYYKLSMMFQSQYQQSQNIIQFNKDQQITNPSEIINKQFINWIVQNCQNRNNSDNNYSRLQSILIYKIISNLVLQSNCKLGYTLFRQKQICDQQQVVGLNNYNLYRLLRQCQKQNIYDWREKNYQYLGEFSTLLVEKKRLWERNSYQNHQNWNLKKNLKKYKPLKQNKKYQQQNNQSSERESKQIQLDQDFKNVQLFFIQLQKIEQQSQKQRLLNNNCQIDQNQNVKFYIIKRTVSYNDTSKNILDMLLPNYQYDNRDQKQNETTTKKESISRNEKQKQKQKQRQLSDFDIDIPDISKKEIDNNNQDKNKQIEPKNSITTHNKRYIQLFNANNSLISSYFPKHKYLQIIQRINYQLCSLSNLTANKSKNISLTLPKDISNLLFVSQSDHSKHFDFIVKIVGSMHTQKSNRKKGSIRKSQIIQLDQNLNHTNFIKQLQNTRNKMYSHSHYHRQSQKSKFSQVDQQQQNNQTKHNKNMLLNNKNNQLLVLKNNNNRFTSSLNNNNNQLKYKNNQSVNNQNNNQSVILKTINQQPYKQNKTQQFSQTKIVQILKKALIRPQYQKSLLLKTYFDSISVSSFYNIMRLRPNYIKLTCFRMKTVYVQKQVNSNFYYLFEFQQKQARTRMHKFIIGDKQIKFILQRKLMKQSDQLGLNKNNNKLNEKNKNLTNNNNRRNVAKKTTLKSNLYRTQRQAKTLPYKTGFIKQNISNINYDHDNKQGMSSQINDNKQPTSTCYNDNKVCSRLQKLKTNKSLKQEYERQSHNLYNYQLNHNSSKNHNNKHGNSNNNKHGNSNNKVNLRFTQQSLTQVLKSITSSIVIKKDYLYTSIFIQYQDEMFYLRNKFYVDQYQLVGVNLSQIEESQQNGLSVYAKQGYSQINKFTNINVQLNKPLPNILHQPHSIELFKTFNQGQQVGKMLFNRQKELFKSNRLLSQILTSPPQQKQHKHTQFLNKQIKIKNILCQKSIILKVSNKFANTLTRNKNINKCNDKIQKQDNSELDKNKETHLINLVNQKTHQKEKHAKKTQKEKYYMRLFSILTIIKISKSGYFTIKLYLPKFQRSYILTLNNQIIDYFLVKDLQKIFCQIDSAKKIIQELKQIQSLIVSTQKRGQSQENAQVKLHPHSHSHTLSISKLKQLKSQKHSLLSKLSTFIFQNETQQQKIIWRNILSLIKIQQKNTQDKVYLIMKISNYHGFIKDCSFLQFFQKDNQIFMLQMTLNKKSENTQYFPKQQFFQSLQKNKINTVLLTSGAGTGNKSMIKGHKQMRKNKQNNVKQQNLIQTQTYQRYSLLNNKKIIDPKQISRHNNEFQNVSSIYQSKSEQHTLFVQIFKIYEQKSIKKSQLPASTSLQNEQNDQVDIDNQNISVQQLNRQSSSNNLTFLQQSQLYLLQQKQPSHNNNKISRTKTIKNTIKSTTKSINFQLNSKKSSSPKMEQQQNMPIKLNSKKRIFSRLNRLKSNYKLLNSYRNRQQQQSSRLNKQNDTTQINKINYSFFLSQLIYLFKYIDQNYSQQFNQQYFVLSQMNTGFKILGHMVIEQFQKIGGKVGQKNVKDVRGNLKNKDSKRNITCKYKQKESSFEIINQQQHITQVKQIRQQNELILINNELTNNNKKCNSQSFNNGSQLLDNNQQSSYHTKDIDQSVAVGAASITRDLDSLRYKRNNNPYSKESSSDQQINKIQSCLQLFSNKQKQKEFKQIIILRLNVFKKHVLSSSSINVDDMGKMMIQDNQSDDIKQNKLIDDDDDNDGQYHYDRIRNQKSNRKIGQLTKKIQDRQQNKITKYNHQQQMKQSTSVISQFVSLHSKLLNPQLIDLHILQSSSNNIISSLFYTRQSLLFLISNIKLAQIMAVGIKLNQFHPFMFINVLADKRHLKSIKNRLYRFYKTVVVLMMQQQQQGGNMNMNMNRNKSE